MRSDFKSRLAYGAIACALFPTLAIAAPGAQLDKSASYVFGNEVRAFRVPTTDATGKIKYFDIVIKLSVGSAGTIASTATVTATASPAPAISAVIVPGTYRASDGTVCTVTNINIPNGRVQSHFSCNSASKLWEAELATGPISSGHPYLAQLQAAKVDKLSDASTYIWGYRTSGGGTVAGCTVGGSTTSLVIGAKTNGSQLILSLFSSQGAPTFLCGGTLVKQ